MSEVEAAQRAFVVLVEDDELVSRALARVVSREASVRTAATLAEARALVFSIPRHDLAGVVLDVHLPDGNGIQFAKELRVSSLTLPILVMTGDQQRTLSNDATALDARFVFKPVGSAELLVFVRSAVQALPARRLDTVLSEMEVRHGLTEREILILRMAAAGVPRTALATATGVSENTVKAQIKRLLHKCTAASLEALVRRVFEQALHAA